MSQFMTEADLGDRLGVPEATVTKWRQRYSWPHVKIGRQVRFTEADVQAIEAQHHVTVDRPAGLPGQTARSVRRAS